MQSSSALRFAAFMTIAAAILTGCKSKPAPQPEQSGISRPPAAESSPIDVVEQAAPRPSGPITFTDVTQQAGIHFKHNSGAFGAKLLPETMGSGVCVIDYDNDGWPDIFFVNSMDWPGHANEKSYPALYHNNRDGTFTDVTRQAGLDVEMYGMGCAVGDFDNDGYDDIYVTAIGGSHLFRNLHNGKFADVTAKAGLADSGFPTGAVWFDYDNDGKLDLFVAHYVDWSQKTDQFCSLDGKHKSYCTPEAYKGESARLFHNLGNGRFEDVTKARRPLRSEWKVAWRGAARLRQRWLDRSFCLQRHCGEQALPQQSQRHVFRRRVCRRSRIQRCRPCARRHGYRRRRLRQFGPPEPGDWQLHRRKHLRSTTTMAPGLFTDQSASAGIASPSALSLTFGCFFFDYDLDGRLDIFAANGHVADDINVMRPNLHYAEPPLLFHNKGQGKFQDASTDVGAALRHAMVARGAAYADFDNDGDLDLVVTTNNGPAHLFRNDNGNRNDMLRIKLVGTKSNRDAIGAKVTLTAAGGMRQLAMVKSGSSYLSQSELPLTFGLGKPGSVSEVSLEIEWPSGAGRASAM